MTVLPFKPPSRPRPIGRYDEATGKLLLFRPAPRDDEPPPQPSVVSRLQAEIARFWKGDGRQS